jgi:monoterpene epsilon-lactone hydrolase
MTSLREHYRNSNRLASMVPPLSLEESRDADEHWGDVTKEPGGVDYLEIDANGIPALWAVPHGCATDRVLLCLHGGGFIGGSMYTHRKMFAHLAKRAGVRAFIPHYRRTPEHRYPAALDDVTAAYEFLLDTGVPAEHIAVTGDSAGGGLTITTVLRARALGRPVPAALMPLSPWVDLGMTGASIESKRATDVLFGGETPMDIEALVGMLLPPAVSRQDPLVSPLHADLTGLPPMYIQVGGDEMLLDDALRLDEQARKAGVDVRLDVFPGQQHTFQMSAGRDPDADEALRRLAEWVRPRLGL